MKATFKKAVPILLALVMCGCSNNAVSDSNKISSSSFESSLTSNESGVNGETETDNSTSISDSAEYDNTADSDLPASTVESAAESDKADHEPGDVADQEKYLSPKAFPKKLEEIPLEYFSETEERGTLADLNYTTYESFSYEDKTQEFQKHAVVYLPYGYNDQEKYNVFYLMHGGWSNETTTLGTPEAPSAMKNVLDNAISEGKISPLIVVCPTYNNTSSEDSTDYGLALQLTRNYHNELIRNGAAWCKESDCE